ncbi:MAG: hypothetical protein QOH33_658 [Paraburkholderia sp.]|nr:hypothetical protein [Paraburkholderia sp.]
MDDLSISSLEAIALHPHVDTSAGAAFAHALSSAVPPPVAPGAPAATLSEPVSGASGIVDSPALRTLARRLDEIERTRIEAAALPGRIARSHADGASGPEVALAMHRQARLLAAYNIDVMWAARVIGSTAGGLRQLITAA